MICDMNTPEDEPTASTHVESTEMHAADGVVRKKTVTADDGEEPQVEETEESLPEG
jgi:hypothetical protein